MGKAVAVGIGAGAAEMAVAICEAGTCGEADASVGGSEDCRLHTPPHAEARAPEMETGGTNAEGAAETATVGVDTAFAAAARCVLGGVP